MRACMAAFAESRTPDSNIASARSFRSWVRGTNTEMHSVVVLRKRKTSIKTQSTS